MSKHRANVTVVTNPLTEVKWKLARKLHSLCLQSEEDVTPERHRELLAEATGVRYALELMELEIEHA
jgi:hypothetical protein